MAFNSKYKGQEVENILDASVSNRYENLSIVISDKASNKNDIVEYYTINNEEYNSIIIDEEGKILAGSKVTGEFVCNLSYENLLNYIFNLPYIRDPFSISLGEFGCLENAILSKVSEGLQIQTFVTENNPEYYSVITDNEDKILASVGPEGFKYSLSLESLLTLINNIVIE